MHKSKCYKKKKNHNYFSTDCSQFLILLCMHQTWSTFTVSVLPFCISRTACHFWCAILITLVGPWTHNIMHHRLHLKIILNHSLSLGAFWLYFVGEDKCEYKIMSVVCHLWPWQQLLLLFLAPPHSGDDITYSGQHNTHTLKVEEKVKVQSFKRYK